MRELIFVDTESTGLDAGNDDLVELTWATIDSDPATLYFGVERVPEFIDNLIGFTKRGISGRTSTPSEWSQFLASCADNTMVAANPAHDKSFLQKFGCYPFHYRMLDIETYAMAKLKLNFVPGMKDVFDILNERGYEFVQPDHTSRNDVLAMREMYKILKGF